MNTLRILYHMARADFLERARRYSFLFMFGLVLWIGYLSASGQVRLSVPPDHVGVINSAWVGATMTITVTFFIGLFGFYLVKGSINRDYETGVGQIMATTPISRPIYILGKWLSNFAVLSGMVFLLFVVGIGMNLYLGVEGFDLWTLGAPLLLIALPCMALVAAFAILFEAIHWLRGGLGNIVYIFLFLTLLIVSTTGTAGISTGGTYNSWIDFAGLQLISSSIGQAANTAFPDNAGGFTFTFSSMPDPKFFLWSGITWTADILLARFFFLFLAVGIAMSSAIFFDRFNPSRVPPVRRKRTGSEVPAADVKPGSQIKPDVRLSSLDNNETRFHFLPLLISELKLFMKGQRWWWYAVSVVLVLFQFFSEPEMIRIFLILAWTWPIFLLSRSGVREYLYNTRQILFSAPRPVLNQLPTQWLSSFIVIAVLGSGALFRFISAGEVISIIGWITGALFIPSLALFLGVLTRSSKTFEVTYLLWMYMLTQEIPAFDFLGMTSNAPLVLFTLLALGLMAATMFVRRQQIKTA
jgi:hypothetical protein